MKSDTSEAYAEIGLRLVYYREYIGGLIVNSQE